MQSLTNEPLFLRDGVEVKDGDKAIICKIDDDGNVIFKKKKIIGFDFCIKDWPRSCCDIYVILKDETQLYPEEVFLEEGDLISHLKKKISKDCNTAFSLIKRTKDERKKKLERLKQNKKSIKEKSKERIKFLKSRKLKFEKALVNVTQMEDV